MRTLSSLLFLMFILCMSIVTFAKSSKAEELAIHKDKISRLIEKLPISEANSLSSSKENSNIKKALKSEKISYKNLWNKITESLLVKKAEQSYKVALQQFKAAKSNRSGSLTLSLTVVRQSEDAMAKEFTINPKMPFPAHKDFVTRQVFYNVPIINVNIKNAVEAARREVEKQKLLFTQAKWDALFQAIKLSVSYAVLLKQKEVLQEKIKLLKELKKVTEALLNTGKTTKTSLLEVLAELSKTQAEVKENNYNLRSVKNNLKALKLPLISLEHLTFSQLLKYQEKLKKFIKKMNLDINTPVCRRFYSVLSIQKDIEKLSILSTSGNDKLSVNLRAGWGANSYEDEAWKAFLVVSKSFSPSEINNRKTTKQQLKLLQISCSLLERTLTAKVITLYDAFSTSLKKARAFQEEVGSRKRILRDYKMMYQTGKATITDVLKQLVAYKASKLAFYSSMYQSLNDAFEIFKEVEIDERSELIKILF